MASHIRSMLKHDTTCEILKNMSFEGDGELTVINGVEQKFRNMYDLLLYGNKKSTSVSVFSLFLDFLSYDWMVPVLVVCDQWNTMLSMDHPFAKNFENFSALGGKLSGGLFYASASSSSSYSYMSSLHFSDGDVASAFTDVNSYDEEEFHTYFSFCIHQKEIPLISEADYQRIKEHTGLLPRMIRLLYKIWQSRAEYDLSSILPTYMRIVSDYCSVIQAERLHFDGELQMKVSCV